MNIANIVTEARDLVDASSTSYTDALLLIRMNNAMEDIASTILGADGRWDWDDTNNTDFPQGTTNLVANQQDYKLDVTYLKVLGVSCLDVNNFWRRLSPFDPADLPPIFGPQIDRAQFLSVSKFPLYYDIQGSSIILYPAPDNGVSVTLTAGLKVYAQRTAQLFTSAEVTTGTKVPGFASPFHILVAYKAALPYAMKFKPERVPFINSEIARLTNGLIEFYSKRDKDDPPLMSMKRVYFR